MLRGIYSAAAGMIMEMDKVSMHAQNIANSQSAGFRRREMSSVPFRELMVNIMEHQNGKAILVPVGTGSGASFQTLDDTQGSLKPTGNTFDLAIEGNGWLTFRKSRIEGDTQKEYTSRNGRMILDPEGFIINAEGHFLVDQTGRNIRIAAGRGLTKDEIKAGKKLKPISGEEKKDLQSRITIDENGKVLDNGRILALLKLQSDSKIYQDIPELKLSVPIQTVMQRDTKTGDLIANITGPAQKDLPPGQKDKTSVKQGFIEESNIQIISEMVGLIHASKDYESGHKLIMAEDKILDKAINELGRTG